MDTTVLIVLILVFLGATAFAGWLSRMTCDKYYGFPLSKARSMTLAALSIFAGLAMIVAVFVALETISPFNIFAEPVEFGPQGLERVLQAACFLMLLCLFTAFTAMALARHIKRGQKAENEAPPLRPWFSVFPLGAGLLTLVFFLRPVIAFADPLRLLDALRGQGEWTSGPLGFLFSLFLLVTSGLLPGAWLHGWLVKGPGGRAVGLPSGLLIWGFLWLTTLSMLFVTSISGI